MTRSSKTLDDSQSRSSVLASFSSVAVALLFLFLHLQGGSPAGDPQGSWNQVHQALGISLPISPTTAQKQSPIILLSGSNLPLRLADPGRNPEPPKDRADLLRDFASLRSVPGEPK